MPLRMQFFPPECPFSLPCLENFHSHFDLPIQSHLLGAGEGGEGQSGADVCSFPLLDFHTLPRNNLHV